MVPSVGEHGSLLARDGEEGRRPGGKDLAGMQLCDGGRLIATLAKPGPHLHGTQCAWQGADKDGCPCFTTDRGLESSLVASQAQGLAMKEADCWGCTHSLRGLPILRSLYCRERR